jgi:phosphoribosylamine--glycine ligase
MHVLVVGGGGREHALAWKLAQSPRVTRISVAPGNAGTASLRMARNIAIDATDIVSLLDYAESEGADLTVVGPEEPLAGGLVDQFEAAGQRIFGPHRQAALIETSKSYAKQLMVKHGVPTAPYEVFTEIDPALDFIMSQPVGEMVIKANGLARGKGVFLPRGESDAEGILRALLERNSLGGAGRTVVIEQRLIGPEVSIKAFTDGGTVVMMPAISDYKRLYDNDVGPNTGGMGAYAPAPALTPDLAVKIKTGIIEPILAGLQEDRCCFKGVLYIGVVLTRTGPMALELNARLGDPGAQVILPLLDTDLMDVIEACVDGCLDQVDVRWQTGAAVAVVLATESYPAHSDPGIPIIQVPPLPDGVIAFHAGTRYTDDGTLVTTGGRVLDLVGTGPDIRTAITRAYDATQRVHFDGVHYRTDIGVRGLWRR